jgi:FecR protein
VNALRLRVLSRFAILAILFPFASLFAASEKIDAPLTKLSFVQGDVRVSTGDGKHPNLTQQWQQAEAGVLLEQGSSLATTDGRAEIEFETGGSVYLAENSLLLFEQLSQQGDRPVTRMSLVTGSATFSLQPVSNQSFFIDTPTDKIEITAPDIFFARMDSYLDGTAITPQGDTGERMVRRGRSIFPMAKGQTVFFQEGEVILLPAEIGSLLPSAWGSSISAHRQQLDATAAVLKASGLSSLLPGGPVLEAFSSLDTAKEQIPSYLGGHQTHFFAVSRSEPPSDWDTWVSARVQQREVTTVAALKASGLSSPIPGLADMYAQGTFSPCEPYGICWEPTEHSVAQAPTAESPAPAAQSPASGAANQVFQPQTVSWQQVDWGWGACATPTSFTVSRVARTPQELEELLRLRFQANSHALLNQSWNNMACYPGDWIYRHRHYIRVIPTRPRPVCKRCVRVHPPVYWVRAGGKVGIVPRHPNDVEGKPPLNLKHGIFVPPAKTGEPFEHVDWDPSQKVKILEKPPKEFQSSTLNHLTAASAPIIKAHLVEEATRPKALTAANHANAEIAYDYKTQKFMLSDHSTGEAKSKGVAVGGITPHGGVSSFAGAHSGRYAGEMARSGVVTAYAGGGRSSGSYSGGGGGSGSYSSGSSYSGGGHSSGSYSSGSSSSGGSSSHSSGGGGSGGSSGGSGGSSGSSTSGSSGGGHAH